MGKIYRGASEVIAWLGNADRDSNLAFDALEALPKDDEMHWDPQDNPNLKEVSFGSKHTVAIRKLFQRPWWHRVWTVQESVLARTLSFVCGQRQMSAEAFLAVSHSHFRHIRGCCHDVVNKSRFFENLGRPMVTLDTLNSFRDSLKDQTQYKIEAVIAEYRIRRSTDPRDKVYGLLGLADSQNVNLIIPDYSAPVSIVYEQATVKLIESSRGLGVFSQLYPRSFRRNGTVTDGLPSWVPDWTSELNFDQYETLQMRQERLSYYNASAGSLALIKCFQQGEITLRGILFDFISVVGKPRNRVHVKERKIHEAWRDMDDITKRPSHHYPTSTSTTYGDAYWQTVCNSIIPSRSSLNDPGQQNRTVDHSIQRSWHDAWWDWCTVYNEDWDKLNSVSTEYTGPEITAYGSCVIVSTHMKRMFLLTERRLLGLAPMDAKVRDRIALLEGGKVPYILRLKPKGTRYYELIGDAYVHGIMDDEAWEVGKLEKIILV